jgi:hypothetical protein
MLAGRSYRISALISVILFLVAACSPEPSGTTRQSEVARRGAEVMPFDLDRTTHVFKPLDDGGIQTVVADDPSDRAQVELVREHLRKEARAFSRGDFGDPARIHGDEMPGLEKLRSSYHDIEVTYSVIPTGGRIRYEAAVPAVVEALHRWFQAQLTDHGEHAEREG